MKKIVIISTKPASLTSGTEVRNYHLLRGLRRFFDVEMIIPTLSDPPSLLIRIKDLLMGNVPYIERVRDSHFSPSEWAKIKNADIIQVQELEALLALEKKLPELSQPIILDAHNVEVHRFLSGIETESFLIKWVGRILAIKIKKLEIDLIKKVTTILTCSQVDKNYFANYFPAKNIIVVPNGIDYNYFSSIPVGKKNTILFMGLLSYGPNNDGLRYYFNEIHSLVKEKIIDVQITIIGKNPPAWLTKKAEFDSSINVKGFVKDIRDDIGQAKVCICPLRYGSGTRLKVLEYMASGKPVVSTSKGAEGINLVDGVNILYADEPKIFAEKIIRALTDSNFAKTIGGNGRKIVEKNYSWDKITKELSTVYNQL